MVLTTGTRGSQRKHGAFCGSRSRHWYSIRFATHKVVLGATPVIPASPWLTPIRPPHQCRPHLKEKGPNKLDYLARRRVAPLTLLGVDQFTIHFHLKRSTGGGYEPGLDPGKRLFQLSHQTGSSWLVVSNDTVFDRYLHRASPRMMSLLASGRIVAHLEHGANTGAPAGASPRQT